MRLEHHLVGGYVRNISPHIIIIIIKQFPTANSLIYFVFRSTNNILQGFNAYFIRTFCCLLSMCNLCVSTGCYCDSSVRGSADTNYHSSHHLLQVKQINTLYRLS